MKTLLKKLFINNWPRKLLSLILGMIIWVVINHSMTTTKTLSNIPVKVINIPGGKTIKGLQNKNILEKKLTLTLTGNKNVLDDLTSNDLQVIIDASRKDDEWVVTITKKNLISFNPNINILQSIKKISHGDFIIKLSKLITERIPILVTQPIGEAPEGYQFLDIWPYHLYITVSGPEEIIKDLKTEGLKLTFNLNDISKENLLHIQATQGKRERDEISFFIPNTWKKITIPPISSTPLKIDDPKAQALRIDFAHATLVPLPEPISVSVFYPPKHSSTINPNTHTLATNNFIKDKNGIKTITEPLFAKGVSVSFVDIVKDMIQIVIIAAPKSERRNLLWNVQFIYPHELEDHYVTKIISQATENTLQPSLHEEYLRNRFRNFMNTFRLYTSQDEKLSLKIQLEENTITLKTQKK